MAKRTVKVVAYRDNYDGGWELYTYENNYPIPACEQGAKWGTRAAAYNWLLSAYWGSRKIASGVSIPLDIWDKRNEKGHWNA